MGRWLSTRVGKYFANQVARRGIVDEVTPVAIWTVLFESADGGIHVGMR